MTRHWSSVVKSDRLMKDIVHKASNQLAVVGVIRDPHVFFTGIHAKPQIGFAETPAWSAVVLQNKTLH